MGIPVCIYYCPSLIMSPSSHLLRLHGRQIPAAQRVLTLMYTGEPVIKNHVSLRLRKRGSRGGRKVSWTRPKPKPQQLGRHPPLVRTQCHLVVSLRLRSREF